MPMVKVAMNRLETCSLANRTSLAKTGIWVRKTKPRNQNQDTPRIDRKTFIRSVAKPRISRVEVMML